MKTTEERAAADRHIDYSSTPELDRRVMRCRCGHSLNSHQPPRIPGDAMLLPEPRDAFRLPPCLRCDCLRYTSRRAPWRVEIERTAGIILLNRFIVRSPRGAYVYRAPDHVSALNIAHQMAALDQLLARVNRIERAAGWHPSHGTPPPREYAAQAGTVVYPGGFTVLDGGR